MKGLTFLSLLIATCLLGQSTTAPLKHKDSDFGKPPEPDAKIPGRFLLVNGKWDNEASKGTEEALYRIDSATGKVWILGSRMISYNENFQISATVPMWQEVSEEDSFWGEIGTIASSNWINRVPPPKGVPVGR